MAGQLSYKTIFLIGGSLRAFHLFRLPLINRILNYDDVRICCIYWGNLEQATPGMQHDRLEWIALGGNHLTLNIFADVMPLIKLIRLILGKKPQAVLAFNAKPILFGNFFCKVFYPHARTVTLMEGLGKGFDFLVRAPARYSDFNFLKKWVFRWCTRVVDEWIFLNPRDKTLIQTIHPSHAPNMTMINGIGTDLSYYQAVDSNTLYNNKRIIFVGRLIPEKGVETVINIAKTIRQNTGWRFAFAGLPVAGGEITNEMTDHWVQQHLIDFCGSVQDMRQFYRRASLLLLPSYYNEGLPASVMEAQAVGIPCLVADQPYLQHAIADRKSGFLLPHNRVSLWIEKIQLLQDANVYKQFSNAARRYAEATFDQTRAHEKIMQILRIGE